ncbi:RNA-directed DNA polymerase-like protein [Gossypium australe]|uniref:RNA-directed DNA polymerase-like protein n=1 Tax=Gossypium australe TaxID=47621 RepID=A0A5B6WFL6_9ROSI|nr:RNA-directed DNA polymerase-like protein [Gossypium australe]
MAHLSILTFGTRVYSLSMYPMLESSRRLEISCSIIALPLILKSCDLETQPCDLLHTPHSIGHGHVTWPCEPHGLPTRGVTKCEFRIMEVMCLGHVVSAEGICVDLKKIEAILD